MHTRNISIEKKSEEFNPNYTPGFIDYIEGMVLNYLGAKQEFVNGIVNKIDYNINSRRR